MVKINAYDKIFKLDRFTGSLEEYRRTKILEGILSDSVQIIPMPTKDISGYVNDPNHKFWGEHQPSQEELSEIIELVDRGCIALVNYEEGRMVETYHVLEKIKKGYYKNSFHPSRGIPVMIQRIGGPYR